MRASISRSLIPFITTVFTLHGSPLAMHVRRPSINSGRSSTPVILWWRAGFNVSRLILITSVPASRSRRANVPIVGCREMTSKREMPTCRFNSVTHATSGDHRAGISAGQFEVAHTQLVKCPAYGYDCLRTQFRLGTRGNTLTGRPAIDARSAASRVNCEAGLRAARWSLWQSWTRFVHLHHLRAPFPRSVP